MSHKDLNPVNRKNPKRVAIVISNPVASTTTGWPVGFWWSELTHPYFRFTELGYQAESSAPRVARAPPTQGATRKTPHSGRPRTSSAVATSTTRTS